MEGLLGKLIGWWVGDESMCVSVQVCSEPKFLLGNGDPIRSCRKWGNFGILRDEPKARASGFFRADFFCERSKNCAGQAMTAEASDMAMAKESAGGVIMCTIMSRVARIARS